MRLERTYQRDSIKFQLHFANQSLVL